MVQHKPSHEPGGWVDFFKPHTDREREHTDWERESMAPKRSRSGSGGLARLALVAGMPAAAGKELLCPGLRSPCNKLQA